MKAWLSVSLLASTALSVAVEPEDEVRRATPRILEGRWDDLSERERSRFTRALGSAVRRELGTAADADSIVGRYRRDCERLLARYSFAYLIGELEGNGVVVLEDFEDGPEGGLPPGWSRRPFGETSETPYRIVEEGGNRFLRAEDRGENVMLYKEVRWDAVKYPYLGFRVRVRAVPEGSDERFEARSDSAAGLYLSYRRKLGIVPETVKLVWSGSLAAGSAFRRPGIGMPWTVVAGSGPADEERWHELVVHVGDIYEKTFAKQAPERPLGIGLLTDANDTKSFAAADYDDIVALERADDADFDVELLSLPKD
jgi:hypothetical protein